MRGKGGIIFAWFFSIFCFTAIYAYGIGLGSVLMGLIGIISLPIKPIRDIWKKVIKDKNWIKIILITILFVVSVTFLPDTPTVELDNENTTTIEKESNIVNDKESSSNEKESLLEETTTVEVDTSEVINESKAETINEEETIIKKEETTSLIVSTVKSFSLSDVPAYSGRPYVAINNNVPYFTETEITNKSYEFYSELDSLGRCGVTYACIGKDIMPTEDRGTIGQVKPTGWHTIKYDIVDGKYLYNRCHLIGFQLTGENANTKNLITGTRSMNVDGMLPFENMVADYITETNNHVMYRVTPIFDGNNLLANGVLMEAKSVEDNGDGILFNVFVYNVQDGVKIDYATGASSLLEETTIKQPETTEPKTTKPPSSTQQITTIQEQTTEPATTVNYQITYVLNTNTKKFHYMDCSSVSTIKEKNYDTYTGNRQDLINMGYDACKRCYP